ncbi:MAG: hypothetical protein V1905_03465 [bacterium]
MKKNHHGNKHLTTAFNEILPMLTKANIKYWVYGGVGIAGIAEKFFRTNQDIDIYVLNNDFNKVGKILKVLCEKHGGLDGDDWALQYSMTKRAKRPKLDLYIKGNELLSVIPIYITKKGVEFRVYQSFPLPKKALSQKLRKIGGFKFYSPPADIILRLFRIYLEQVIICHKSPKPISRNWRNLIDAKTILPKKEIRQFIIRYNKKAKELVTSKKTEKSRLAKFLKKKNLVHSPSFNG